MAVARDDPRIQRCGFAKLQGENLEYFIRKYEVVLGRRSNNSDVDVVLGEGKNLSRKHAMIRLNFEKGIFELIVMGKNGVSVGGVLHTPESGAVTLHSRDVISVADQTFCFLLPADPLRKQAKPSTASFSLRPNSAASQPATAAAAQPTATAQRPPDYHTNAAAAAATQAHQPQYAAGMSVATGVPGVPAGAPQGAPHGLQQVAGPGFPINLPAGFPAAAAATLFSHPNAQAMLTMLHAQAHAQAQAQAAAVQAAQVQQAAQAAQVQQAQTPGAWPGVGGVLGGVPTQPGAMPQLSPQDAARLMAAQQLLAAHTQQHTPQQQQQQQ